MNIARQGRLPIAIVTSLIGLTACAPVETKTALVTPISDTVRTVGPGDVVMAFQARRSLPNIVGQADIWGRTTDAGGTTVRYVGTQGDRAVFQRSDVVIHSNATTMSETPLIIPHTTSTSVTGMVGTTPVSASARSTSYQFIPARGSSEDASATTPIQFSLGAGQSATIQGRTLKVIKAGPASVEYRIK